MNDTPKVWIACLASYNAGRLIGEWVDATDLDEMNEARDRVAAKAVEAAKQAGEYPVYFGEPEEFAIHDYDNFGGLSSRLGEYPNWETVARIGALIEEQGDAFIAYLDSCEVDLDDPNMVSEEEFYSHFRGEWDNPEAYARYVVGELGWANVPAQLDVPSDPYGGTRSMNVFEELDSYLDWESIARELFQHGNYTSVESPSGDFYIFEQEV